MMHTTDAVRVAGAQKVVVREQAEPGGCADAWFGVRVMIQVSMVEEEETDE